MTNRTHFSRRVALALIAGAAGLAACGDGSSHNTEPTTPAVIDPGDGGNYHPSLDPAHVAKVIDNPYMPLAVGSTWKYEGAADEGIETITIEVTRERQTVMGLPAVVVHDVALVDGVLVEDTIDWYVQDDEGNVWYLGERVKNYENGVFKDDAGSWEAGVDGALPGIVMPASPVVGDAYRQEYLAGVAEDMFKVVAVDRQVEVRAGSYSNVVVTNDWTPLTPAVIEEKSYALGVGLIFDTHLAGETGSAELVEFTIGG